MTALESVPVELLVELLVDSLEELVQVAQADCQGSGSDGREAQPVGEWWALEWRIHRRVDSVL